MASQRKALQAGRAPVGLRGAGAAGEPQDIEALKRRYDKLREERTRAETNLDNAKAQLENLKRAAREDYATDDLEELKAKLDQMKQENERKRSEYQATLERIENDLRAVDARYQQSAQQTDAAS